MSFGLRLGKESVSCLAGGGASPGAPAEGMALQRFLVAFWDVERTENMPAGWRVILRAMCLYMETVTICQKETPLLG